MKISLLNCNQLPHFLLPHLSQATPYLVALGLLASTCLPLAAVNGQEIVSDGNFDNLEVGSAPNNDDPAGAWEILINPRWPEDVEDEPGQFSVVPTASFDSGAIGNSLRVDWRSPPPPSHTFLENTFEPIPEADDEIIRASFDVFMPDMGTNSRGGLILFLASGGELPENRGPQLYWDSRGKLGITTNVVFDKLVDETPLDEWQHVQLDIDLSDDSFDLFWSSGGDALELVAPYQSFHSSRSDGTQEFLDRLGVLIPKRGAPWPPNGEAFLDNINIEVLKRNPGDANLDGEVNFLDFLSLSEHFGEGSRRDPRGWSQGDFDGNKEVDFPDFLILSENFGGVAAANASVASVPEPTGLSIVLFGLLGLIGLRRRR